MNTQPLTQLEFEPDDFALAERVAKTLGYTQTAYTSTSALWGLFCLPDHARMNSACIIKTRELGLLVVQDLEDLHIDPRPRYYECGGCGYYHRFGWVGDCRQDDQRFTDDELPAGWVLVDEQTGEV